jgi:hypothetical protein
MASLSAFRQGFAGMVASSNGPFNMLLSSPMAQWVSIGVVFVGTAFPEMYDKTWRELWPALLSGYKPAIAPSGNEIHTVGAGIDSDWILRQVHWLRHVANRNSEKVIAGLAAAGFVLVYRLYRTKSASNEAPMSSLGRELTSLRDEIKLLRQDMALLRRRAQLHESTTRIEYQEQVDTATHVELLVSAAAESTAMLPDNVPVDSLILHELEVFPDRRPHAEFKSDEERSLDDGADRVVSLQVDEIPNPGGTTGRSG